MGATDRLVQWARVARRNPSTLLLCLSPLHALTTLIWICRFVVGMLPFPVLLMYLVVSMPFQRFTFHPHRSSPTDRMVTNEVKDIDEALALAFSKRRSRTLETACQ